MKTVFYALLLSMFILNSMHGALRPHPERGVRNSLAYALARGGRGLMHSGRHFDSIGYVGTVLALVVRDQNR